MGNFCGCNYKNQSDNKDNNDLKESSLTSVYIIILKYII